MTDRRVTRSKGLLAVGENISNTVEQRESAPLKGRGESAVSGGIVKNAAPVQPRGRGRPKKDSNNANFGAASTANPVADDKKGEKRKVPEDVNKSSKGEKYYPLKAKGYKKELQHMKYEYELKVI